MEAMSACCRIADNRWEPGWMQRIWRGAAPCDHSWDYGRYIFTVDYGDGRGRNDRDNDRDTGCELEFRGARSFEGKGTEIHVAATQYDSNALAFRPDAAIQRGRGRNCA